MISRRKLVAHSAGAAIGAWFLGPACSAARAADSHRTERLAELESLAQGRLGVHVIDTGAHVEWGYRPDERFMMLSSFKVLASALVLARADQGNEDLARRIRFGQQDLIPWSPVTQKHADGEGMTLAQLCEATITTSDNTAGNLILASYGGPPAVTAFARRLGDQTTRLDRNEPTLNTPSDSGLLDTTTPRAMARTLQQLLLANALSEASRGLLKNWMLANTTGANRLKAGLPKGWAIGDKTGTNKTDANDIGIVLPPGRDPIIVTTYLAGSTAAPEARDHAIAGVAQLLASERA